uniref:Transcription factor NACb n=1 Tax=Narcissus tazetta TaxID=54860 RepID=A0A1B1V5D0_NARTA|nr:transcription factor NACb [Narcissus tazetta]
MENLMRLPPGFRFHPTDEELVVQYLKRKALSCPLPSGIISEIDLRKYDPWDLPGCQGGERYFFNLQEPNHRWGNRLYRATESGYWKTTGKERPVVNSKHNELVGMKKTLVFYQGKLNHGIRTQWIMHEYRLTDPQTLASTSHHRKNSTHCFLPQCEAWVVCRIFMKRSLKIEEDIPQHHNNSQVQNLIHVGFMEMANNNRNLRPPSPSSSSCITNVSDEECSNGEEAISK